MNADCCTRMFCVISLGTCPSADSASLSQSALSRSLTRLFMFLTLFALLTDLILLLLVNFSRPGSELSECRDLVSPSPKMTGSEPRESD